MSVYPNGGIIVGVTENLLQNLRLYAGLDCQGRISVAAIIGCHVLYAEAFHQLLPVPFIIVAVSFVSAVCVNQPGTAVCNGNASEGLIGRETEGGKRDNAVFACLCF